MRAYISFISALSRAFGWLSMTLLAAAAFVTCWMVAVRYLLGGSTIWQTEFVIYAAAAATFLGAPYVLMLKGHVGVDLLTQRAAPPVRRAMEAVAALISMLFIAALGWSALNWLIEAIEGGWRTDTVWGPPLWAVIWPLPVGLALLLLQYVAEIIRIFHPELREAEA